MASAAQITANQLNAQKSTGPRSSGGKAASSKNAIKHGIDARSAIIPGEDPAEREALANSYLKRCNPATPEERFLVDALIDADWNRRRYQRIETQLMQKILDGRDPSPFPLAALFDASISDSRMLERVIRQRAAAERAWFRAHKELESQLACRARLEIDKAMIEEMKERTQSTRFAPPAAPWPDPFKNLALRL